MVIRPCIVCDRYRSDATPFSSGLSRLLRGLGTGGCSPPTKVEVSSSSPVDSSPSNEISRLTIGSLYGDGSEERGGGGRESSSNRGTSPSDMKLAVNISGTPSNVMLSSIFVSVGVSSGCGWSTMASDIAMDGSVLDLAVLEMKGGRRGMGGGDIRVDSGGTGSITVTGVATILGVV